MATIIVNIGATDKGYLAVSVYRDDTYVCDFQSEPDHILDMLKLINANVIEFQEYSAYADPDKKYTVHYARNFIKDNSTNGRFTIR